MTTVTTDWIYMETGDTTTITLPANTTCTVLKGNWTGIDTGESTSGGGPLSGGTTITFPNPGAYTSYTGSYTCYGYYENGQWSCNQNHGMSGPGTGYNCLTGWSLDPPIESYGMSGSYSWSNNTVLHTTNPWFYIGNDPSDYAGYGGALADGVTTGWCNHSDPSKLVPGTNTIHHGMEAGSHKAYVKISYTYNYNRPTLLKVAKCQVGSTVVPLRLVSTSDPALVVKCIRCNLGGTVYAVDAVNTNDSEASKVRFQRGTSIYSLRKEV